MNATPFPLVPVGRDCDCGHPMVWYGDEQRCAVYGRHPAACDRVMFRRPGGEFDELIRQCMDAPNLARRAVANRERVRRLRREREVVAA